MNERSSGEPDSVPLGAAPPQPQPPTQYPYELLKIIRDNMNAKDNNNLWALLNNIAGPMIIKNVNASPFGIPPPPLNHDGGDISSTAGQGESALLHAMEQNFIQNHPGYELLANAIFSNGGLLPNYFADPLLSTFPPPAVVPVTLNNNDPTDSAGQTGSGKTPTVGSPDQNSMYLQEQQHHNMQQYRMSPSADGGDNGSVNGAGYGNGRHPSVYSPPLYQQNGNSAFVYNSQYNPAPFFYNGHMFYPRPKNFWNFCLNCKKGQYCQLHDNNYNSSASAFYTNAAYGNFWQHQYIAVPNNYYYPHHHHHHHNRSYHNSYYAHHHQNTYNHHGGGGGYRDKRNNHGRRQYQNNNKQQGNRSPPDSSAASTPSGSCPASPKTASPSPVGQATVTAAVAVQQKDNTATNKNNKNDHRRNGGDRKARMDINHRSNNNNGGKNKRWQGTGQRVGNEYDSDTSSSRSNGSDSNYVLKCNYGLLQNMKLWNTETVYKKEQLLAGELGSQQLMSPTNHKNSNPGPLLMTIAEAQGATGVSGGPGGAVEGVEYTGDFYELTTTLPAIQHEEQLGSESAYWSSIFPFTGGLEEGVGGVEESTPADKYLANAHLMEVLETPKELVEGMPRDTLSHQIWNTFLTVQQTQATYKKKLVIWKLLYASIKVGRTGICLPGSNV